jgi:hypothetical protein
MKRMPKSHHHANEGGKTASGLARTEVKKAMTGTAFETLLEPISQPALEHESSLALSRRSEP